MGKQFSQLSNSLITFIQNQKIYFVGTALAEGRVNISPKGMDSFRVISPNRVIWLNVTGSGNETAIHVSRNQRMTIMFTSFEGPPLILRLYGKAKLISTKDSEWSTLCGLLPSLPGARQIFDLEIDLIQTSCGMAVPQMTYQAEREQLNDWVSKKTSDELEDYWTSKNSISIDGFTTIPTKA
jgi:hypothetical protein